MMKKYRVSYELQGGKCTCQYFDKFIDAFLKMVDIYDSCKDSDLLKSAYATTEIQKWDEQSECYISIRK